MEKRILAVIHSLVLNQLYVTKLDVHGKKDIGGNTSPCIKPVMCKEIRHTWKMILAVIHSLVLNQLYITKLYH